MELVKHNPETPYVASYRSNSGPTNVTSVPVPYWRKRSCGQQSTPQNCSRFDSVSAPPPFGNGIAALTCSHGSRICLFLQWHYQHARGNPRKLRRQHIAKVTEMLDAKPRENLVVNPYPADS